MNDHVGNFGIPNTAPNVAMAATVQRRLQADTAALRAKNAFWRLSGFGVLAVLVGGGLGLALYGYSYVTDQRAAGGEIGHAIAEALRGAKLEGTVKLADGSSVKLDPNATVRLDTHIDINGPRPTDQQLAPNAMPPSAVKPVTNYTIFKSVKFDQGEVVTGWNYTTSADTKPNLQYCYYTHLTGENVSARFTIGTDGLPVSRGADWDFDNVAAFSNCTWFNPVVEGRKS